ncbi:hypothetical protein PYEL_03470 [Pseudomonas sp. URMO17WK12:I11]|nr:hypothetical protein PYEL_03470 [Pseudomonas sp. URMO17WK12:I11]
MTANSSELSVVVQKPFERQELNTFQKSRASLQIRIAGV